jgi:hypothetical protein
MCEYVNAREQNKPAECCWFENVSLVVEAECWCGVTLEIMTTEVMSESRPRVATAAATRIDLLLHALSYTVS